MINQKYIFQISLSGIRCVSCANKIKESLKIFNNILDIKVNVIEEKIILIMNDEELNSILAKIDNIGYKIISEPIQLQQSQFRQIQFNFNNDLDLDKFFQDFYQKNGILTIKRNLLSLKILYDPSKIKGVEFQKFNLEQKIYFEVISQNIEQLKIKEYKDQRSLKIKVFLSIILIFYFITFGIIFPSFEETCFLSQFQLFENQYFMLYLTFSLTILSMLIYGLPVYISSYQAIKQNFVNMDTLITMGSLGCLILFIIQINDFDYCIKNLNMNLESLSTLSLILNITYIGRFLEKKAKQKILQSQQILMASKDLARFQNVIYLESKDNNVIENSEIEINVALLEQGDYYQVKKNSQILIDSYIVDQDIFIENSIQYGNDEPQNIMKGNEVKSGAKIIESENNLIQFQVINNLDQSLICQISNQIDYLQNNCESEIESNKVLLKQVTQKFVLFAIFLSIIDFIIWTLLIQFDYVDESMSFGAQRAISLIVISCPCAFGLAIPLVVSISLQQGLKKGILIKKNNCFDKIKQIDSFIFDKTGTLIQKLNQVNEIIYFNNNQNLCLNIIHILEKNVNHPIAQFLFQYTIENIQQFLDIDLIDQVKIENIGISGVIKYQDQQFECHMGNLEFLQSKDVIFNQNILDQINQQKKQCQTCIFLSFKDKIQLAIFLDNKKCLRPEAQFVINQIQNQFKKEVYLLSGDDIETVISLGEYLGIKPQNCFGNYDVYQKKEFILEMKKNGRKTVYIGDGLNDILCLQEATIGISINTQSQLNLQASDIILLNPDLRKILYVYKILQNGNLFIKICIFWAFSYNIIMIPMASGIFYKFNMMIPPFISAFAMSLSSIMVVLTANFIKCISLDKKIQKEQFTNAYKNIRQDVYINISQL